MKLTKKMMAVHLLASFLITETAMARISAGDRKSGSGDSKNSDGSTKGQGPSNYKTSEATKDNYQVVQGTSATCSSDQSKEKYFPLQFFNEISRDEGAGLDIVIKPGNKILVKVPPTINVCGQFVPEFRQDKDSKNVTIFMKLIGDKKVYKKDENGKTILDSAVPPVKDQLLSHKDFEECMEAEGITAGGKIDWDKVPAGGYSESLTNFDYDFDKKLDVKKKVIVSYGYPRSYNDPKNGYDPKFGFDDDAKIPGEACMRAEKIAADITYINKGKDVLISEINETCKSGDAQKIAAARANIGNYDALRDIADKIRQELDTKYLSAVKVDVESIYKDLKEIDKQLNKERNTIGEDEARTLAETYASKLKELNTKFLDPAIMQLSNLMQQRSKLDAKSPEVKAIDEDIKKLNEDIGQYAMMSQRDKTAQAGLYTVLEKYALNDSARTIEEARLKSYVYSRVYAKNGKGGTDKRGDPLTFEAAAKTQNTQIQVVDKKLTAWADVYSVAHGNTLPLEKVKKEQAAVDQRMRARWAAYEQKELKDWQNYCSYGMLGGQKNPVKCQEWNAGLNKRRNVELEKRKKDLKYIASKDVVIKKMNISYGEYQREVASRKEETGEDEDYDGYASAYTDYDETFAQRFPEYYGTNPSIAYSGSSYNMGGISSSMQMGQQQQYMPQMQMGQTQQYQLQQGAGQVPTGWATMP